jgi:hypothetical protein
MGYPVEYDDGSDGHEVELDDYDAELDYDDESEVGGDR